MGIHDQSNIIQCCHVKQRYTFPVIVHHKDDVLPMSWITRLISHFTSILDCSLCGIIGDLQLFNPVLKPHVFFIIFPDCRVFLEPGQLISNYQGLRNMGVEMLAVQACPFGRNQALAL